MYLPANMNSVVWPYSSLADVEAAQVGGDAVAAGVEGELVRPGADLRVVGAGHQQRVLAAVGQVGDAELAVPFVDPAGPVGEDVAEAVFRLGFLEGRIGDEVVAAAGGGGQEQKGGRGAWESRQGTGFMTDDISIISLVRPSAPSFGALPPPPVPKLRLGTPSAKLRFASRQELDAKRSFATSRPKQSLGTREGGE